MRSVPRIDPGAVRRRLVGARRAVLARLAGAREQIVTRTERPRAWARPVTSVVSPAAWVLAATAVAALWGALALRWVELWAALFFLVALLAICGLFIIGSHQLQARLDLTRDRVVVGERARGRLLITNSSARRTLPMTVELPVGQGGAGFGLPPLKGHAEHEAAFDIPTGRRAVLTVGPVKAVRSDPLMLVRREQALAEPQLLYVHPRTVRIGGSSAGFVRDLEGQTIRKITDSDVAFHALRQYQPGDDRRYIHWKSTARTGTLMVRQFEETRRSHLMVALSTRLDDYASDEEFELAVSVAGSLGVQALDDDQTVSTATSTRRLRSIRHRPLLDDLAGVDYDSAAPRLSEVVRRLAREVQGASVAVIVCGSVVEAAEIRRARRHLAVDVRTITVRTEPDAEATIQKMGGLDIASIGRLEELPPSIRRLIS